MVAAQAVLGQTVRTMLLGPEPSFMPRQQPGSEPSLPHGPTAPWPPANHPCQEGTACHQRGVGHWAPCALTSPAALPSRSVMPFAQFDGRYRGSREGQVGGKIQIDTRILQDPRLRI